MRKKLSKDRIKLIAEAEKELLKRVEKSQRKLYAILSDLFLTLESDRKDGTIKFSVGNNAKIRQVRKAIAQFASSESIGLVNYIRKAIDKIFELGQKFYKVISPKKKANNDRIKKRIFENLGYNRTKNELIKDGFLYNLAESRALTDAVISDLRGAIGSKNFKTFLSDMKTKYSGSNGQLVKYYQRNAFDVFQQYDRIIGNEYKKDLGLKFAIWSGTIKNTTTDFCRKRENRVYSEDEMSKWDAENDWAGKKENNNVFVDGHGYNCRFVIDWISEELAEQLTKTETINGYNQI